MDFNNYITEDFYDEFFEAPGKARPGAAIVLDRFKSLPPGELLKRQKATEARLFQMGVTFTVYGSEEGTERIFPFDIIPRIIEFNEWVNIEQGLKQRIYALNLFINDIYHDQKIIKDNIIPKDIILSSNGFKQKCVGLKPPKNIWCHITGTDLIRDNKGEFFVLEDNLRCPSGVSYVIENRNVLKRTFPKVFEESDVKSVADYPNKLLGSLQYLSTEIKHIPSVVLLTPGQYNSAYYEHSFLAQQMGIELVEAGDLVVSDSCVFMKTTKGLEKVDVIYR
ncbi:MAG: circularly permuted type 2 ATP-grasp protein, partial [Thermodesulfobacteriota bacterium]